MSVPRSSAPGAASNLYIGPDPPRPQEAPPTTALLFGRRIPSLLALIKLPSLIRPRNLKFLDQTLAASTQRWLSNVKRQLLSGLTVYRSRACGERGGGRSRSSADAKKARIMASPVDPLGPCPSPSHERGGSPPACVGGQLSVRSPRPP